MQVIGGYSPQHLIKPDIFWNHIFLGTITIFFGRKEVQAFHETINMITVKHWSGSVTHQGDLAASGIGNKGIERGMDSTK